LYDRAKGPQVQTQLAEVNGELKRLGTNHPRFKALDAERRAMEDYLNVTTTS
jgi:hypothetical protein